MTGTAPGVPPGVSVSVTGDLAGPAKEVTDTLVADGVPARLAARDATAHAPSPNWLEVDRDALRGRVLQQPKREELVQIQLNEQLIVELYSK